MNKYFITFGDNLEELSVEGKSVKEAVILAQARRIKASKTYENIISVEREYCISGKGYKRERVYNWN